MDLKQRMIQLPRGHNKGFDKEVEVTPPLSSHSWEQNNLLVSGQTNGISTQGKSTKDTMESAMEETSKQFRQKKSQTTTSSVPDSPARASQSQGKERVSKTQGELFSTKSAESHEIKDQDTYYLRMLRDCSRTRTGGLSPQSFFHWMTLGTMSNGRCSTRRISGFRRTGKECSLSDILEKKVDSKYFLSEKAVP